MRRNKRKTSGAQAAAVAAICILFVMTALLGLYKCFSKDVLNAIALNQRSRHLHIIFFVVNVVHPS